MPADIQKSWDLFIKKESLLRDFERQKTLEQLCSYLEMIVNYTFCRIKPLIFFLNIS